MTMQPPPAQPPNQPPDYRGQPAWGAPGQGAWPPPGPPSPPVAPHLAFPPPHGPPVSPSGPPPQAHRTGPRAAVVGVLAGLLIGGVGGIAASYATGAAAQDAAPKLDLPHPFPGDVPGLPSVTVSGLRRRLESRRYECRSYPARASAYRRPEESTSCYNGDAGVSIYAEDDTHVTSVVVSCRITVTAPKRCDEFVLSAVPVLVVGNAADTEAVAAWVRSHRRVDQRTSIGAIDLEATVDGKLTIAAAG